MALLTRSLASTEAAKPLAERLVLALCTVLGLEGGSITIGYSGPDRTTICATDQLAEDLEELHDVLREGPALDAFRTGQPVAPGPAGNGWRWPMLERALVERDARVAVLAVPMVPHDEVLGVVCLHGPVESRPHLSLPEVQFLANAVGVAVLGDFDRVESTDMAWSTRDRINQATGMVVAQLRIPPGDALALLRSHAFAQGVTLRDVCALVLDRSLDFRDNDGERRSP